MMLLYQNITQTKYHYYWLGCPEVYGGKCMWKGFSCHMYGGVLPNIWVDIEYRRGLGDDIGWFH